MKKKNKKTKKTINKHQKTIFQISCGSPWLPGLTVHEMMRGRAWNEFDWQSGGQWEGTELHGPDLRCSAVGYGPRGGSSRSCLTDWPLSWSGAVPWGWGVPGGLSHCVRTATSQPDDALYFDHIWPKNRNEVILWNVYHIVTLQNMSRMHLSAQFMAAIQDNSKQYFASMTESFKILRLWTQMFKLILKIFLDLSLFQIYKKSQKNVCIFLFFKE